MKLDLPPISQVQARGLSLSSHPSSSSDQRPLYMNSEAAPSLPLPDPHQAYSSGTSSPRVSSVASSSSHAGSQSSFTSASSHGPKTPSPTLPVGSAISGSTTQPLGGYDSYATMNQSTADMYYQQHMSAGQAQPPPSVTSGPMTPYHSQPPALQPSHIAQYPPPPPPPHYSQPYPYANGLTSPQNAPPNVPNGMGPAQNVLPLPGANATATYQGMDTTGQVAPPGMKPRVTATLWEDEGSLCFQVEARGICVARREGT